MLPLLLVLPALAATPAPPPPLVACPATPLAPLDEPSRLSALAANAPAEVSAWVARTRTDVPVVVGPGVRAYPGNAFSDWRTVTVLSDGSTVTLLAREGPINLIIGVDRTALAPLITRPVALVAAPGQAPAPHHVDLVAGAEVKILGSEAGFTNIAWAGEHLTTTGWVPDDALGPIAAPCLLPDELHDVELLVGGPAIEVRDAPDGRVIAWVATQAGWMGRSLGKVRRKSGAWSAIVWTEGGMRVAGYVPSSRLQPTARAHLYRTRQWVDVYTPEAAVAPTVLLPAGAVLSSGSTPFAHSSQPVSLPLLSDDGRTVRVRLTTAWGSLEGTTPCERRTQAAGGLTCTP